MKINPDVIRNLQIDAGTARTEKAKDYYEKGKVKIVKATYENDKNFSDIEGFGVKTDGKWGFLDKNGKKILSCKFDEIICKGNLIFVKIILFIFTLQFLNLFLYLGSIFISFFFYR